MGSKITRYLCSRKRTMGYGVTVTQQILVLFFQVRILVAQRSGTGGVLVCIEIGLWCNGNTTDSGPVFPGSSPGSPTQKAFLFPGKAFCVVWHVGYGAEPFRGRVWSLLGMNLLFPCCFCLLLDFYDFHRRCLELRHAHADVGPDVRGVAHGVGLPADHDVVAFHR